LSQNATATGFLKLKLSARASNPVVGGDNDKHYRPKQCSSDLARPITSRDYAMWPSTDFRQQHSSRWKSQTAFITIICSFYINFVQPL